MMLPILVTMCLSRAITLLPFLGYHFWKTVAIKDHILFHPCIHTA